MIYLPKYDGYMADNPNIEFERCDGKVFAYDEVNSASLNNTHNMLTITGGQGNFPLAYIDTDSTLEFQFESSLFTMEMFEMANATHQETGDFGTMESKRYEVEADLKINIPYECLDGSVKINGFEQADTAAEGKFTVAITAATTEADGATVVTFNTGDVAVGDVIRVAYKRRVSGASRIEVSTTSTTAKGALYAHWPIYSSGTDCTEASIKGWLHLYIPRVRVTALPGFSNSYKSHAAPGVTFAALDPHRADGKMYDLVYEPTNENGVVSAKASAASVDWD